MGRIFSQSEFNSTLLSESVHRMNHLVEACKRNDLKAQLQLYKIYYREIFNISLSIVKDIMLAEDIMQESFLSAFERIGSCSGIISFDSGLKKIVENRSLSCLKSSGRSKTQ